MGSAARSSHPWIRDAGALLAVPIGLVAIHLLVPAAVRDRWAFHFHEPSLFAVWMSAFLHRTVGHLLGNLVLYVLVVTTAYLLFHRWNRTDEFWIMLVGFLVIIPPIITSFEYAALWYFLDVPTLAADSIGFSGIGHAYAGMLAAGLGWYTADRYTTEAGVGVTFLIYTLGIAVFVYPIFGSWAWGGLFNGAGWLENVHERFALGGENGFLDFAGSTVVHSIGGWAALAGTLVLGARIGKYDGSRITPISAHNIPLAALGVFILWLGWFGFNPGSTTAIGNGHFAYIAVTTNLSAAAGAIAAMVTSWVLFRKPDPSFALNGALAGLVAITAGCDVMPVHFAALTGLLAGILVVVSCVAFDKIRIDDPVGAISVHGVCGAFGTLAVGLFHGEVGLMAGGGPTQLIIQAIGVAAGFLWAFPVSLLIFLTIKNTVGLRVSEAEEIEGLDLTEHGVYAYPPSFVSGVASSSVGMGGATVHTHMRDAFETP